MIDSVPPKAVIKAAEAERRMLDEDLQKQRIAPDRDISSILAFCNFLEAAARGFQLFCPDLPSDHAEFYRRTVEKLVTTGTLPTESRQWFELIFPVANSATANPPVVPPPQELTQT